MAAVAQLRNISRLLFGNFHNRVKLADIRKGRRNSELRGRCADTPRCDQQQMEVFLPALPVDGGKRIPYAVFLPVRHGIVSNRINIDDYIQRILSGETHGDALRLHIYVLFLYGIRNHDGLSLRRELQRPALQKGDHVFSAGRKIDRVFNIHRILIRFLKGIE